MKPLLILCPIYGFLLQQSVLVSEELINFRYKDYQSELVWPEFINLETFKAKQAPAVLNIVATLFHGVSKLWFIDYNAYQSDNPKKISIVALKNKAS